MIAAKQNVPSRLDFEPHIYVRDKNAIIVEVDIKDSWARIGYIPKQKAPKFTTAIRHRGKGNKFKNVKCQYVMADTPLWTYVASVLVIKVGRWPPNDYKYRYSHQLHGL